MAEKTKILMTGITGYIGGSVFCRLLQRPDFSTFDIRAIVRSSEKAEKLKKYGVTSIIGSHTDFELMKNATSDADIVITMANVDDVDAAQGVLAGLKKKFEKTGKKAVLLHTSGTAVLGDDARGEHASETVYDDIDPDQVETLTPDHPHRPVDLAVVGAAQEGYADTYIVLPPTIWGTPSGPLFDDKIANSRSYQLPALVKAGVVRGQGGIIGKGANIWPHVEVHELTTFYSLIMDNILMPDSLKPSVLGTGRNGFYFASSFEYNMYEVAETISNVLVDMGKGKDRKPTSFSEDEINKYFGVGVFSAPICDFLTLEFIGKLWISGVWLKLSLSSDTSKDAGLVSNKDDPRYVGQYKSGDRDRVVTQEVKQIMSKQKHQIQ
ncbi:hypothetical protein VKT23_018156 [Stygiomarasmius scandens]|uniref:NmrA-like domain-containing protein n=1 Tax=Marasmiellus scandens TaxID=2682957 RepID=A0ABR1IQ41_9AGAR